MADEEKNKASMNNEKAAETTASPPTPAGADACAAALTAAERTRDEYLAGWQRAKADLVNYRREEAARLEEVARWGNEDFIRDLITVLDNFDLGLRALEKDGPVEKGVYLIRSQIQDMLTKRGLAKIALKPGDPFDPGVHEAMTEVAAAGPPGMIVEEIEPGYLLNGRVLRAARVIISKEK